MLMSGKIGVALRIVWRCGFLGGQEKSLYLATDAVTLAGVVISS
jgi:hypothetical protein